MLLKILHFLSTFVIIVKCEQIVPKVVIPSDVAGGPIITGSRHSTWNNEDFYSFRGIPFAQPPIGELRFKDPRAIAGLPALVDARYDSHDCPSIFAQNASEDCLTLNVYTKNLSPSAPLPVLVFIHPGGLYIGSGLSSFIGPEYLLSKSMVLVTFNYRLGSLGFLNLGTAQIPGNAGFKDQVYALRWVQQYIQHFGGNPADVTLMGYSAGGLSASLHLVSPMSRGLFHKIIISSGTLPPQAVLPWGQQLQLAQRQAQILNCANKTDNWRVPANILECLNSFEGTHIASTLRRLFVYGKDNPIYLWLPVVEEDFGQERFLVEDYYESLREGRFHRVPVLIGYTNGELCNSAADIIPSTVEYFNEHFEQLAPSVFMYDGRDNARAITALIRSHYQWPPPERTNGTTSFSRLCGLFSDAIIRFGAARLTAYIASQTPVHAYYFSYIGNYTNGIYPRGTGLVEHLDDLMYLFRMQPHFFQPNDKDAKLVELYTKFIYDFITNGTTQCGRTAETALIEDTINCTPTNYFPNDFWNMLFPTLAPS